MSFLHDQYQQQILPKLMTDGDYGNVMRAPRLLKIVISTGIGTSKDRDVFEEATRTIGDITGQRPVITKARLSIANFKLREGVDVGAFVTLRGERMYDFLYRLIYVALPRVRDFRGVNPKSFDGSGNYSMGLTDQTIFTEINLDKMKHTIGMNITVVTTAQSNEEGFQLLSLFGMPFAQAS